MMFTMTSELNALLVKKIKKHFFVFYYPIPLGVVDSDIAKFVERMVSFDFIGFKRQWFFLISREWWMRDRFFIQG